MFQNDSDPHAAFGAIADGDGAAVEFDDFLRHRQSEAGALAGRFGGKKRVKDFGQIHLRDAGAGIGDFVAGERLKLAFLRDTAPNCAQKVVFPKLGIEGRLDPGGIFVVELPAPERGEEIRFTCGMGMYKGTLVAVGVAPTAE